MQPPQLPATPRLSQPSLNASCWPPAGLLLASCWPPAAAACNHLHPPAACRQYDEAWAALHEGNQLQEAAARASGQPYDPRQDDLNTAAVVRMFQVGAGASCRQVAA